MRKIINLYSIILVVIFLSVRVEASTTIGGKSFFAPQSLMAMLAPLSMRSSLIIGDNESKKTLVVHLRPLVQQPKMGMLPSALSSPMPMMPSLRDRSEWSADKSESSNDGPETPQAMPLDALTIPLNDVESSDALTIPLNEIVEPRMMPSALSYDAPNLNNNVGYLTPDKTQSNDKNMNLGNMQMVSKPTPNKGFIFGMVPFYIKSTNGPDLRHYFFPGGKDELVVKGSLPAAGSAPDVSGTWLNIVGTNATAEHALLENNFQSTLQISPTYEYVGAHLHLRKQMGHYWSDVQLPIAQVSVDHGIKEYNMSGNVGRLESVATFVKGVNATNIKAYPTPLYSVDAASAFSQQSWQYHKLSKKPLKHVGMGDATLKIGMNYGSTQFFTKFVLPTSQPRTNTWMFEPQLGNGGHVGMGGGVAWADVTTVSYLGADVGLQAELEGTYLFSNVQMRTFDVTSYGAFSRFLQFKIPNGAAGYIPSYAGVNTLTKKTTVSPVGEVNALLASSFVKNDVQLGLTYSLHCTMPESLKISDAFIDTYGVASTLGDTGADAAPIKFVLIPSIEGSAAVAGAAAPGKKISVEDLDLDSAARPLTATSQIAASFGFAKKILHEDVGIHCIYGMSINHNNATLSTWLIALQVALKL